MISHMPEWSTRSRVPAALLNPALLAAVLAAGAAGYTREAQAPLPWPLSFVLAPLVLHQATREALPSTLASHLGVWVGRQPEIRAGLPLRALSLVEPVREGLRFGLRHTMLELDGDGFRATKALRPPDAGDLRPVLGKATFVGRWFSRSESPATVFALLGVTV